MDRIPLGSEVTKKTIPTGTSGAIKEYLVIIDLLSKGFEVFRASSPSCSCDLVASKDAITLRVEVKTAKHSNLNRQHFKFDNVIQSTRHDVIAGVLSSGKIVYVPALDWIYGVRKTQGNES